MALIADKTLWARGMSPLLIDNINLNKFFVILFKFFLITKNFSFSVIIEIIIFIDFDTTTVLLVIFMHENIVSKILFSFSYNSDSFSIWEKLNILFFNKVI